MKGLFDDNFTELQGLVSEVYKAFSPYTNIYDTDTALYTSRGLSFSQNISKDKVGRRREDKGGRRKEGGGRGEK